MNATAKLVLSYIAPGGSSQNLNFAAALTYVGSATGFLDIPEGAADGTSYAVPFGTVTAPKLVALQNNTNQAIEVAVNASEDVWTVGAGDMLVVGGPAALGITSLAVLTTALTTADGSVAFVVLGDEATP
jgi:hypothetical protein